MVKMRIFGHIDGIPVGVAFPDRRALLEAGVHRQLQAGIAGSAAEGADSIVVSGGYEDDDDFGDLIIYTGQGGNDPATKRQVADQRLTLGNAALAESCRKGLPVRVIRGRNPGSIYAPPSGFRYDGLYYIEEYWQAQGKSGFSIWRFRLISQERRPTTDAIEPGPASRVATTVQRLVRSTQVVQRAKELHSYACQVCGSAIEVRGGWYAEGAHIRPLGHPHNGPDVLSNVLCLCPNDHVRFDFGAIWLDDDLWVVDGLQLETGHRLRTVAGHEINLAHVRYHRELWQGRYPAPHKPAGMVSS
jgi:putative restriction endonuclease